MSLLRLQRASPEETLRERSKQPLSHPYTRHPQVARLRQLLSVLARAPVDKELPRWTQFRLRQRRRHDGESASASVAGVDRCLDLDDKIFLITNGRRWVPQTFRESSSPCRLLTKAFMVAGMPDVSMACSVVSNVTRNVFPLHTVADARVVFLFRGRGHTPGLL